MGKFTEWVNEIKSQDLKEFSALDLARAKSDRAFGGVADSKFKTTGGLTQIVYGDLKNILERRGSEDPSGDKNAIFKAIKEAYRMLVNEHRKAATAQPSASTPGT
jgi:hypothetical protein